MNEFWPLLLAVVFLVAVVVWALRRSTNVKVDKSAATRRDRLNQLDTVEDWPPEGTRLLGSAGRKAHAALVAPLPECMIFAQVPLARFVRVPRRQSYSEWITRVGHMAVDFLICDQTSFALGVIVIQSVNDTERAQKRRESISRVLQRAGIKVFVWREEALPSAGAARDMIVRATALTPGGPPAPSVSDWATASNRDLPLPEVSTPVDPWGGTDRPRDPPPSTWFDDLDSGHAPPSPD